MKKDFSFLISAFLFYISFSTFQISFGNEQREISEVQMSARNDVLLETTLGFGENVLLNIEMNLLDVTRILNSEQDRRLNIPLRIFLTTSPDTSVNFEREVDCQSTSPVSILTDRQDFESSKQFRDWLSGGYFANKITINYDFCINVSNLAQDLLRHLSYISRSQLLATTYRFTGTHEINNRINPDECIPEVKYFSERGNQNRTRVELKGILKLNGKAETYDRQKIIPHRNVLPSVQVEGTTFYSRDSVRRINVAINTYEEIPDNIKQNWPSAPSDTYKLLINQPEIEQKIEHLYCWSALNGDLINITSDRRFLIIRTAALQQYVFPPAPQRYAPLIPVPAQWETPAAYLESIIKDNEENLYIVRYRRR